MSHGEPITDEAQLRALLGEPVPRALAKERTALHERDLDWLAASPFCLIATSDADGHCDVSPKGDPPGFVHVVDATTVAVPERPGNRRGDGYHNILSNPHAGLISMIPGRGETLRLNGRAHLVSDAPFFDAMITKGHRPIMAMVLEIDQIFFHCAKALMRSGLWKPATWEPDALPSHARLVAETMKTPEAVDELEAYYAPENYSKKLYAD